MALAVLESFSWATAATCPAVIRIARAIEPEPRLRLGAKSRRDDRSWPLHGLAARHRNSRRAPIVLQRRLEPSRIRHRRPSHTLDRQRGGARRGLGCLPRIAVTAVAREERRREDVASPGGIGLDGAARTDFVPIAVDVE